MNLRWLTTPPKSSRAAGWIAAVEQLDHTHSFLDQASCQDAILRVLAAKLATAFNTIHRQCGCRLSGQIHNLRYGGLHAASQLVARNSSGEIRIGRVFFQVSIVEALKQLHRGTLVAGRQSRRAL